MMLQSHASGLHPDMGPAANPGLSHLGGHIWIEKDCPQRTSEGAGSLWTGERHVDRRRLSNMEGID